MQNQPTSRSVLFSAALLSVTLLATGASPSQAQTVQSGCESTTSTLFGSTCVDGVGSPRRGSATGLSPEQIAKENELQSAVQQRLEDVATQEVQHQQQITREAERAAAKEELIAVETARFEKLREEVKQRFVEICENYSDRPVSPNTPGPAVCRTVAVQ